MPPTSIDGTDITGATIDGTDVQEITVDGQTVFSAGANLPVSGLSHRYDASELTGTQGAAVSLLEDKEATSDLTTKSGQPTLETSAQNGLNAVNFDGNDSLNTGFTTISQPFHVFVVFKFDAVNTNTNNHIFCSNTTDVRFRNEHFGGGLARHQMFAGNGLFGSATDTNWHIASTFYNGANSHLRLDGVLDASGDPGANSLDGLILGEFLNGGFFMDGKIGEVVVYEGNQTSIESDVESFLNDKWAVF